MTLLQLHYFVTAAECESITEAAKKLYISQPSLSNALHKLEDEMGLTIFVRSNNGIRLTEDGDELLSFSRQLLEQADIMKDHFMKVQPRRPRFSVSTQHIPFAISAFADLIKANEPKRYLFSIRESQTDAVISDVAEGRSEIGICYLFSENAAVLKKSFEKNSLIFSELITTQPRICLANTHPLAHQERICPEELIHYPYLVYEQGSRNSIHYAEEFLNMLNYPKNILVSDRATLYNLLIGLNGFAVFHGVADTSINDSRIISKPLATDLSLAIGVLTRKEAALSRYGEQYLNCLNSQLQAL